MAKKKQQSSRCKARRDKGPPAEAPEGETVTMPHSNDAAVPAASSTDKQVTIVGIGASAGGLDAFTGEARRLLEASRDAYAELYDFAPIPYFTLDCEGLVKEANLVGCSLLQIERARLIGLPLLTFIAESDRPAFMDHLRQCRTGALEVSSELNVKSRSGKITSVMLTSRLAATGEIDAVRTVMADTSIRRQAEAEIRNLNATLEQRVRERTADLERANENLRHEILQRQAAESALQKADRMKDDFVAMLGHELRNPLGILLQSIELWRAGNMEASRLEQVEAIAVRQVRHIARLVDDLLDVSRISRGKIVLRKRPTDVAELVRAVVRDLKGSFEASGLELVVDGTESPTWVDADPVRIAQVVGNLLHNAQVHAARRKGNDRAGSELFDRAGKGHRYGHRH